MSSLMEVVSQGSITNALTGVKRPLQGNPTSVPKNLPAHRGVPNTPGNAVKAPKLNSGNRPDRGTNVLTPVARVTPLTSIAINMGRLSPGDVAFVRRTPGGYLRANFGVTHHGQNSGDAHMTDMVGLDGVNRFLSGTLNGSREWKIGDNLIDLEATPIDDTTDLFGKPAPDTPYYLSCLREYKFDGVVLSNEEPYSFNPTEGRDATIFNIGIKGAAPVNNGYMVYDTNAATELYSRGKDPCNLDQALRVGSERASETWHGKVGYDFIAAYTSVYTEYPLQMFGRDVSPLDSVYLLLRKFNIEVDVVEPRVYTLLSRKENGARLYSEKGTEYMQARNSVISQLVIKKNDGTRVNLLAEPDKLGKYVFFQYMPCSSRSFCKYRETLKKVHKKIREAIGLDLGSYAPRNAAIHDFLKGLQEQAYTGHFAKTERHEEHDAVRFLDIHNCAGAWKVGKVIDTRSARATPYANGPTNSSYRMTVVMDIEWLPRNKSMKWCAPKEVALSRENVEGFIRDELTKARRLLGAAILGNKSGNADRTGQLRTMLATMKTNTLSERELCERQYLDCGYEDPLGEENIENYKKIRVESAFYNYKRAQGNELTYKIVALQQEEADEFFGPEIKRFNKEDEDIKGIVSEATDLAATASSSAVLIPTATLTAAPSTAASSTAASSTAARTATAASSAAVPSTAARTTTAASSAAAPSTAAPSTAVRTATAASSAAAPSPVAPPTAARAAATRARTSTAASSASVPTPTSSIQKEIIPVRKPAGKPVTASAASAASTAKPTNPRPTTSPAASAATPPPPQPPTASSTASSTSAPPSVARVPGSSLVNATIAASRKATMETETAAKLPQVAAAAAATAPRPAAPRSQGVVDSVFDTIFGSSSVPTSRPLASPSSPTPSSGSETGPRAFTRRNR